MITKEQVIENYIEVRNISTAFMNTCMKEDKKVIINSNDPKEREKAMNDLCWVCYSYEERLRNLDDDVKKSESMYNDMLKIVDTLSKAFKCEWLSNIEFAVSTNHTRLSDFAKMIGSWFNVTSTNGFTFDSCFTTHNAKTVNGLALNITCTEDGRGLLVFEGLTPKRPYWVPRDFVDEEEAK